MAVLPFAPNRNSRHRIAVIALYRALLRVGSKVELPEDVTQSRRVHPVKHAIRKRFASNVALTSPRFLYAAMAAGYRLWDTLCKARETDSKQHQQVVEHFRKRIRKTTPEATEKVSRNATKKSTKGIPVFARQQRAGNSPNISERRERPPLLTKISEPGELPKYTYNFDLPQSELKRRTRKVPQLATTSDGYPFVRLIKPQPLPMSKNILGQDRLWKETIWKVTEIEDVQNYEALAEDEWDDLVVGQMAREGIERNEEEARAEATGIGSTYVWTVQLARMWFEFKLERKWQGWTARGAALHDLVLEQRSLGAWEAQRSRGMQVGKRDEHLTPSRVKPSLNAKVQNPFKLLEAAMRSLPPGKSLEDYNGDPFTSPFWSAVIDFQGKTMMKGARQRLAKNWLEERKHLREERNLLTGGAASPLFFAR